MKSQAENVYTTVNKILYIAPALLWGKKMLVEDKKDEKEKKGEEEL